MRARRRIRERDRPAAPARKPRQQPFGHRPDDLRVDDLRPPRLHRLRAVQARLARTAFRRRIRGLPLAQVRIPQQAFPLVTGLAAALAVLPALPLGLLPGPPCLFRPDPLLRAGRARVRAVHRQPPLQLRDPQLQPAFPIPRCRGLRSRRPEPGQRHLQARRQHRDLLILRPDHSPQPRNQVTLLASYPGLIGHEPKACSTCTKSSITGARRRAASRTQISGEGIADLR